MIPSTVLLPTLRIIWWECEWEIGTQIEMQKLKWDASRFKLKVAKKFVSTTKNKYNSRIIAEKLQIANPRNMLKNGMRI
jgi:hypothetical protein